MTDRYAPETKLKAVTLLGALTFFIPLIAGASNVGMTEGIVAVLSGGQQLQTMQEFFFGIVLPLVTFFAVFWHLIYTSEVLDKRPATIVALSFAFFATRALSPYIIKAIRQGALQFGGAGPGAPFPGLTPIEKAAIALLVGTVLPFFYFHHKHGQENRSSEFSTAEIMVLPITTAIVWMWLTGFKDMTMVYSYGAIFAFAVFLLWAWVKTGGLTGLLVGFVGLYTLGWGFKEVGAVKGAQMPPILVEFGNYIMQGAITIVMFAIFLLIMFLMIAVKAKSN